MGLGGAGSNDHCQLRGDGTTVLVSSPSVSSPVAVRYGWDTNPVCNLYNKENLPAVPFRTDDWPGGTKPTDQQVIYPPSAMPRVDMHTHMDAKTQYSKAVDARTNGAAPSVLPWAA